MVDNTNKSNEDLLEEISELRREVAYLKSVGSDEEKTVARPKLFNSLIDHSNDSILVIDPSNAKFLVANNNACENLGYSHEELMRLGVTDIEAILPDAYSWKEHVESVKRDGSMLIEGVHKRKDGTTFPVEVNVKYITIDKNNYMLAIARDTTERKVAEKTLHESKNLLEVKVDERTSELKQKTIFLDALSRAQSQFISRTDPNALFDELLNSILDVTGSEYGFIGQVLYSDGKPYLKNFATTDISWNEETRSFYETNSPDGLEFVNLDNLFGAVITSGKPVITNDAPNDPRAGGIPEGHPPLKSFMGLPFYSGETLIGMVALANREGGYDQSIIEFLSPLLSTSSAIIESFRLEQSRITAEKALRDSETQKRLLLDSTAEGIYVINKDCKCTFMNKASLKMFGYNDSKDILIKEIHSLTHHTRADGTPNPIEECEVFKAHNLGKSIHVDDDLFWRKDGTSFPVEYWSLPIVNNNEIEGSVITFIDITERKKVLEARTSYTNYLKNLQRIHDASRNSILSDESLKNVISEVRSIFNSDRAWLLYPCDSEGDYFEVPYESTLPEYPGASARNQRVPFGSESKKIVTDVLNSSEPVTYTPLQKGGGTHEEYSVLSQIVMAIKPQHGKPWIFGLHQCSYKREWTDEESALLKSIGSIMTDMLSADILYRDLRKISSAVEWAGESVLITDSSGLIEYVNPAFTRITGYSMEEVLGKNPSILKSDAQDPLIYKDLWETISHGNVWEGLLIDKKGRHLLSSENVYCTC